MRNWAQAARLLLLLEAHSLTCLVDQHTPSHTFYILWQGQQRPLELHHLLLQVVQLQIRVLHLNTKHFQNINTGTVAVW